MFGEVFVFAVLTALVTGGRAPNADVLEDFKKTPLGSKFSDDIYADALLDVPDLISKYGYPVETHTVTTSDGYILTAHRIPRGRDTHSQPGSRPVVFLMHGLLSSSADYVVLGPGNALAYLLAEEGYDVWMGNARGNFYSRKHSTLDPDRNTFWRFSWEEIGLFDLSTFVDYILKQTGESQLHYVGHSQGGTTFLVLNSLRPEYNAKFKSFQGLAPTSYFDNNENDLYNILARYEKLIETAALGLGMGEILSKEQSQALVTSRLCDGRSLFDPTCVANIQAAASETFANVNSTMIPIFLSHAPAGASIRQVTHYAQVIRRKVFARFYHNVLTNIWLYGSIHPPQYDMSAVTVPSFLYYGLADKEVNYRDVLTLAAKLGNTVLTYRLEREDFNHFDFIWGNNVRAELFDRVIENIKSLD